MLMLIVGFAAAAAVPSLWAESDGERSRTDRREASADAEGPAVDRPTTSDPENFLLVRPEPWSERFRKMAVTEFDKLREGIAEVDAKIDEGKLKSVSPKVIGQLFRTRGEVQYAARRLENLGEPASMDIGVHNDRMQARLYQIINSYKALPGMAAKFNDLKPLNQAIKRNEKRLKKVETLARAGRWDQVDDEMHDILQDLFEVAVWYDPVQRDQLLKPFYDMNDRVKRHVIEFRSREGSQYVADQRAQHVPDFAGLIRELEQAATAVGKNGTVELGGMPLSGPQWVAAFGDRWRSAHFDSLHCQGRDMARAYPDLSAAQGLSRRLIEDSKQFNESVVTGIAYLISADAERVTDSDVPRVYAEYLAVLAPLKAIAAEQLDFAPIEVGLQKLADRSPDFKADVAMYKALTSDRLRWMERVVNDEAAMVSGSGYANLDVALAKASEQSAAEVATSAASEDDERPGKGKRSIGAARAAAPESLRVTQSGHPLADRYGFAENAVEQLSPKMVGQSVIANNVFGARDGQPVATSRMEGLIYGRIIEPIDLSAQIADLSARLFVDEQHPPLSLEAAAALESLRRGDFLKVGGNSAELAVEGTTTQYATLTEADWGITRLGPIEDINIANGRDFILKMNLECRIKPAWARHRYYFVTVN